MSTSLFARYRTPPVPLLELNMAKDGDLSNEAVIESIARLEEAIQEAATKRVPFEHPTAQAWLKDWVHGVYEGDTTAPRLPYCGISASQAGVALLEQFNDQVQQVIPQYPEEYQRNSVVPTMVLARVLVAWQETFKPDAQDWLNLRTNMGLYQRQHEDQWREQFDDTRPSLLSWLYAIPKVALGYEITEEQAKVMQRSVRASDNVPSRFWTEVITEWKDHAPALDASIGEQLAVTRQAIATTHLHHTYGDALPLALDPTVTDPLTLPVPVRDYQKGWDVAIRKMGLEYSQEAAKAEFPNGIPDTVDARAQHLKLLDVYYQQFERALEPWRWDGLKDASLEEKAEVFAWLTGWAPEFHWDTAVQNMGIYPPVEANSRQAYTGQTTLWWLQAPYRAKVEQAKTWIAEAELTMTDARQEGCDMDAFVRQLV